MWSNEGQAGLLQAVMAACLIGFGVIAATPVAAQPISGNQNSQFPSPQNDDVAEQEYPFWTLAKLPPQSLMREIYWNHPADTHPFFRDSLLQLVARTYYFDKDNFNGTKSRAWTGGGWIAFRSGLIGNVFGVHVAGYTSQPLFAPAGEGGTRLLTQEQDPLNVIGQAYGRIQIFDQEIRGGRMLVDTPLISPSDNRMVPNTFEGVQVVTLPDKDRMYDYAAGYLWTQKPRDSNDFISMSDSMAGADVVDREVPFGMVRVRPLPGLTVTAMDYYLPDFVNTAFAQVEYGFQPSKQHPNFMFGANVIDQRSVGANLLSPVPFDTFQFSAKAQMSYMGWTLFAAGSITGDERQIVSPYSSKPNYTDMQQISFDNANEKAIGASIAYDFGYAFGQYGLTGFSAGVWYTQGWDAINPITRAAIADRSELDLWLQYRPSSGPLQGLRVRTAFSEVWQDGNVRNPQPEFRFIVDYTVLFRPPPPLPSPVLRTKG